MAVELWDPVIDRVTPERFSPRLWLANAWAGWFGPPARKVLVACFMKSGSTWLSGLIGAATGLRPMKLHQPYLQREMNLDDLALLRTRHLSFVGQCHVKATERNRELIQRHGIRPVVLTRRIPDVLVSIHDFITPHIWRVCTGIFPPDYHDRDREAKLTFLIHNHLPWYFHFYVSWREAARELPVLWTRYETIFGPEQEAELRRILAHCGQDLEAGAIQQAVAAMDAKRTRKNVGVAGRGEALSPAHKEMIQALAATWDLTEADRACLGLGP